MKKDIEYQINRKRGIVTCVINNCEDIAWRRIVKYMGWIDHIDRYVIPDSFIGMAHCSPEDAFDEEYGKRLAFIRAKAERCKAVNEQVEKYVMFQQHNLGKLVAYGIHNIPKMD